MLSKTDRALIVKEASSFLSESWGHVDEEGTEHL